MNLSGGRCNHRSARSGGGSGGDGVTGKPDITCHDCVIKLTGGATAVEMSVEMGIAGGGTGRGTGSTVVGT